MHFRSKTSGLPFFQMAIDMKKRKCYHDMAVRERYTFPGLPVIYYNGLKTKGRCTMERYALIRVSSKDQNEARQVKKMLELGIPKDNIVVEKESGKSNARVKYHRLVKRFVKGDEFTIENVDRLSRDYDGIIREWQRLTTEKGVTMKVLDTPMLNTDQKTESLLFRFIRNIMLHILAFQAENEWQKSRSRQAEGIAIAKAEGKQLGRPKTVRTEEELEIAKQYQNGEIGLNIALSLLGKKKTAFYELLQVANEMESQS